MNFYFPEIAWFDPVDVGESAVSDSEDDEVISTVQQLLDSKNQSDGDLTYDEIQACLDKGKSGRKAATVQEPTNGPSPVKKQPKQYTRTFTKPQIFRKQPVAGKQQVVEKNCEPLALFPQDGTDDHLQPNEEGEKENAVIAAPLEKKEKRSRKQKLTLVNRGDSEIIIQAAALMTEEEEVPAKKRGRRKRKSLPDPDYNPRTPTKKMRKSHRHSKVEVINIDVEEEVKETEVVDITMDEGKEKNSSDKENNVIEVGDSDEDEEEDGEESDEKLDSEKFVCEFCSRSFRSLSYISANKTH